MTSWSNEQANVGSCDKKYMTNFSFASELGFLSEKNVQKNVNYDKNKAYQIYFATFFWLNP